MKFSDPFKILTPNERWASTQSQMDAFQNAYEKLLPPLVYKIRLVVEKWREGNNKGASETSKSLLNFWFNQEHLIRQTKFSFFFSQRESIKSIIYLYEVAKAKDKYELMKFDSSQCVSTLSITDKGTAEVKNFISLKLTKPKVTENQPLLVPKKSVFNKIIGDNPFELEFSSFCESRFDDVISFAKNTFGEGGVNFSIEYQKENGNIASFFPTFLSKHHRIPSMFYKQKGVKIDDVRKIKRLATWC